MQSAKFEKVLSSDAVSTDRYNNIPQRVKGFLHRRQFDAGVILEDHV